MKPRFREDKTTQAAAKLLDLNGGQMNYMKLIKLLYLIDREALMRWGRPVTFDAYVSMKHGPVLSHTLNLINEGPEPGRESYWDKFISEPYSYSVSLKKKCVDDELSDAEVSLIEEIFRKYQHLDQWEMVNVVHALREWQDPGDSAIPIDYRDILEASNKTEAEIAAIVEELESLGLAQILLR